MSIRIVRHNARYYIDSLTEMLWDDEWIFDEGLSEALSLSEALEMVRAIPTRPPQHQSKNTDDGHLLFGADIM